MTPPDFFRRIYRKSPFLGHSWQTNFQGKQRSKYTACQVVKLPVRVATGAGKHYNSPSFEMQRTDDFKLRQIVVAEIKIREQVIFVFHIFLICQSYA